MKLRLLLNVAVAIFLVVVTAEYGGERVGIVGTLETQSVDWRLSRNAEKARKNEDIVIVDIDRDSLRELGGWPWPRNHFAEMNVRLFQRYRVLVAGYALPFSESDESGLKILDSIRDETVAGSFSSNDLLEKLDEIRPRFDYDSRFLESLGGRAVVLGYAFDDSGRVQAALPKPVSFSEKGGSAISGSRARVATRSWPFMRGFSGNLHLFLESVDFNAGQINVLTDSDGVVRRTPAFIRHAGGFYASLPVAIIRRLVNVSDQPVEAKVDSHLGAGQTIDRIDIGRYNANLNKDGSTFINFQGAGGHNVDFEATPAAVFRYLPFSDVMKGQVNKSLLEGKIVLIGSSSEAIGDIRPTPVNPALPRVEILATQLANLLDGMVLYRQPGLEVFELVLTLFLAVALSVAFVLVGPVISFVLLVVVAGGYVYFVLGKWDDSYEVWSMVPLLMTLIGSFLFNVVSGFVFEWQAGKRLQSTFGQYVPTEIAKRIGSSGQKINLEGEERELTVLFSDIRNFTSISERMSPRELTLMMNTMLTDLSEAIHRHNGTVDKYIGDAVMAFWNAPLQDPRHAQNAVKAAFEMQAAIRKLSEASVRSGGAVIQMGVGICTGNANVGNMGSSLRMAYTVIGDTVNLASRAEGLTKVYSSPILVTEDTRKQCDDEIFFRIVDVVQVKGREQPVTLYEPVGSASLMPPEEIGQYEDFEKIRQTYMAGNLQEAERLLQAYRESLLADEGRKPDALADVYGERIQTHLQSPPEGEWSGITRYSTK